MQPRLRSLLLAESTSGQANHHLVVTDVHFAHAHPLIVDRPFSSLSQLLAQASFEGAIALQPGLNESGGEERGHRATVFTA
jgi:hypothetical protein